jgi:hypothetical protein
MPIPKQLITKQDAIQLCANFKSSKANVLKTAKGTDDANAIWYSLEELEDYIAYIKSEALAKNYVVDGIRFYLGAYPKDANLGVKSEMTTIFLTPTGKKANDYTGVGATGSPDISDIAPMNYGTMGIPPIIDYPSN